MKYTTIDYIEDLRKIALSRAVTDDEKRRVATVPIYWLPDYHHGAMLDGPHLKIPDSTIGGVTFNSSTEHAQFIELYAIPHHKDRINLARVVLHELAHVASAPEESSWELAAFGSHGPRWELMARTFGIIQAYDAATDWDTGNQPEHWVPEVYQQVQALPQITEE